MQSTLTHSDRRRRGWTRRYTAQTWSNHVWATTGSNSTFNRVGYCGTARTEGFVTVKSDGERAWLTGLNACGSIWTCAPCCRLIRARRQIELTTATDRWTATGGQLTMLTLTLRHKRGQSLKTNLTAVLTAWRELQTRAAWRRLSPNIEGTVRCIEVTQGENGWHPHLHILLMHKQEITTTQRQALSETWCDLVGRHHPETPSRDRAAHFLTYSADASKVAAKYIYKLSRIGAEITGADTKNNRDAMALLDNDTPENRRLFIEYADTMKGRQSLAWSKGLRKRLQMTDAKTDEELAEDNEKAGTDLLYIEAAAWNNFYRERTALDWLETIEIEHDLAQGNAPPA